MERPLVVIGHKNPDTDSVCAAIGYAQYKSDVEHTPATAFRAGNLNAQTRFALDTFDAEPPELLPDVYPRIRDIMIRREDLILLRPDDPIAGARTTMLANRFSFLPVTSEAGTCLGKLTALRLAGLLDEINPYASEPVELHLPTLADQDGSARTYGGSGAERRSIPDRVVGVVVPPRVRRPPDHAILFGRAREILGVTTTNAILAIATDADSSARLDSRMASWARETGTPLFALGAQFSTACALVRLSRPVSSALEDIGPTFRSDATLREALREVNRSNEGGFIVLDAEERVCGVVTRMNFMADARFRVVLVDHNEFSQAVDGMEHAEVVEVVDHHRIGGRGTSEPITFINRAVGSTCTLVADMFRQSGTEPPRMIAGLLLSGVLSDTVILRSPTTTSADKTAVAWLAGVAEVDPREYGEMMFDAGSEIREASAREILERDLKYYEEADFQFSVSQVEMVGFKAFWDRSSELTAEVDAHRSRAGLHFASLMVTDITVGTTLLVMCGEQRIVDRVAYAAVAPGVFEMRQVLSRKKQVLPYLTDLLHEL